MKLSSYVLERASFFPVSFVSQSQTQHIYPILSLLSFSQFPLSLSFSPRRPLLPFFFSVLVTTCAFLCIISALRITGVTAVICVHSCSNEIFLGSERNISKTCSTVTFRKFPYPFLRIQRNSISKEKKSEGVGEREKRVDYMRWSLKLISNVIYSARGEFYILLYIQTLAVLIY